MNGSPAPFPQPSLKLLLSSEASQEVAMEMGPQAEHDNDLGQEGATVGVSALLDTRPAHVLSPRKDVRRRTRDQSKGRVSFQPAMLASCPSAGHTENPVCARQQLEDAARVASALRGGEHCKQMACHRSYTAVLGDTTQNRRLRG